MMTRCNTGESSTPANYLSKVVVPDSIYKKDSLWLTEHVKERIRSQSGSFYMGED
jgi:hypothetical protein